VRATSQRADATADGDSATHPDRALRVVLVAPPYFPVPPPAYGGIESVVADLADGLVARGHDVTVLGAGVGGTRARHVALWPEVQAERLGDPAVEVVHAAKVRRVLDRLDADLVHDHTLAGPLTVDGRSAPTIATVHGPVDCDLRVLYFELGSALPLVAISRRQRVLAPELSWTATVHNGVDVRTWPFLRRKEGFALFLGRFCPDKAPHLALEAAHEAGLPLVLAGKCAEPAERAYFKTHVAPRLHDTDTVFGVADAVAKRDLLSRARCLLFPIQWEEPFGMVLIEAMACGTPVVAMRRGAVPELVLDGVTGVLCDHAGELAGALHDVARLDPASCREHVNRHFSLEHLTEGYERAYREVLSGRTDPAERGTESAASPVEAA
jgi:glycosyltransferase involved in cell wall biosynthesis